MTPRRSVGGYIWKAELERLHEIFDSQRRLVDGITAALKERPFSPTVVLTCAVHLALSVSSGLQTLRNLEQIGGSNGKSEEFTETEEE